MFMKLPYFYPEDGNGGSGNGDSGGDSGGTGDGGGGGSSVQGGADSGAQSLRAQLAAALDPTERESFVKWSDGYSTDKDFAKAAIHMRSAFDARVPIPKPDSKPEDVNAFWEKVGRPTESRGYSFDWGKDEKGEPLKLDDERTSDFEAWKEYAFQHNFTQPQFEAGIKFLNEREAKREALFKGKIIEAHKQAVTRLKEDWGPDFEANLDAAADAGVAFADNEQEWAAFVNLPLADGVRVGDHPTLLRAMAKIGRLTAEDQRVRTMHASGEADTVKSQIEALEQEAMQKGHSTAQEPYHSKLAALYQKLYPKKHSGQMGAGFGGR